MSDSKSRVTTFEDNTQHTGGGGASAPSRFEDPLDCPTGDSAGQVIAPGRADPAWDSKEEIARQRDRRGRRIIRTIDDIEGDTMPSVDPLGDVRRDHPDAYDRANAAFQDFIKTEKEPPPKPLTRPGDPHPRRRKTDA